MAAAAIGGAWGCGNDPGSALHPAGRDADQIATLFWAMTAVGGVVWLVFIGLATYAMLSERRTSRRAAVVFIVGGGVGLPTLVLAALVWGGLSMLPGLLHLGRDDAPIAVGSEQWWWRVRYATPDGIAFETANELRVPVGRRTAIALTSPDVVHSLWVPAWAGKVDAIPGRTTHLAVEPTRAGTFRGVCAEYCGNAHAQMVFDAVAMEGDAYDAWIEHQAADARAPATEAERAGRAVFEAAGCGGCHVVRGTGANGVLGPDLTHVGSRLHVAGVVDNDEAGFARWLAAPRHDKPDVHMPAFASLAAADLAALATYLESLQ